MAKTIPQVGTRLKYPWKQWTNGKAWRAEKGKDFDSADALCDSLYARARRHGLKVKVHQKGQQFVEFQFSRGR